MCDPEKCPLSEVCEQRVTISEHFRDAQHEAIEARHEAAVAAFDAEDSEGADLEHEIGYARDAVTYLGDRATQLVLECDIVAERLDQIHDTLYCPGVIKQRKYGFFGPVVSRICGSESRTERLNGRTERLEPAEAYTLLPETEEL